MHLYNYSSLLIKASETIINFGILVHRNRLIPSETIILFGWCGTVKLLFPVKPLLESRRKTFDPACTKGKYNTICAISEVVNNWVNFDWIEPCSLEFFSVKSSSNGTPKLLFPVKRLLIFGSKDHRNYYSQWNDY